MKQVILTVEESKYHFLIEVLKHFDFVKIEKENSAKKTLLKEIAEGMHQAELAAKGTITTRSAKSFLNEL